MLHQPEPGPASPVSVPLQPCLARFMPLQRAPGRYNLVALLLLASGAVTPVVAAQPPVFGTEECSAHSWLIPFPPGRPTLGPFAMQRLDKLVAAWRMDPGPILASGRVDGQEDHPGQDLSSRRLAVVLRALADRGLPAAALWGRDDHGTAGVAPNTPGQPEPQNRAVWIEMPDEGTACSHRLANQRRDWISRNCLAGGHGDPGTCRSFLELLD